MTIEMAPSEIDLMAAREAGLTLVQWRTREALFAAAKRGSDYAVKVACDALFPMPPIRLTLPFTALVPDNRKYGVIGGKLILTKRYRNAKYAIRGEAKAQYHGPALDVPCQLTAHVWFPRARGDAPNFAKACHDALQGICYLNDGLIYDARWLRAGLDTANPRAEITITPCQRP